MMKELSKTGYSLAVIQAIALRMAFACTIAKSKNSRPKNKMCH